MRREVDLWRGMGGRSGDLLAVDRSGDLSSLGGGVAGLDTGFADGEGG